MRSAHLRVDLADLTQLETDDAQKMQTRERVGQHTPQKYHTRQYRHGLVALASLRPKAICTVQTARLQLTRDTLELDLVAATHSTRQSVVRGVVQQNTSQKWRCIDNQQVH